MPRMTDFITVQQNEQAALVLRAKTSIGELPQVIGMGFGKLAGYFAELGETLSDVPFIAYHTFDMQETDIEIGFPVAHSLPGKDDIQVSSIPAGTYVFCMYRGPYNQISSVYEEMEKWLGEHGYVHAGPPYECYYNGPEVPESELLTKISMRVVKG